MLDEYWLPIPQYESYSISTMGKIKAPSGNLLTGSTSNSGHISITLCSSSGRRREYIHRLVLEVFDRNPKHKEQCRHLDGDPTNNHIDNLKWGFASDNARDRVKLGEVATKHKLPHSKLTTQDVIIVKQSSLPPKQLADKFNVSISTIYKIKQGVRHTNV